VLYSFQYDYEQKDLSIPRIFSAKEVETAIKALNASEVYHVGVLHAALCLLKKRNDLYVFAGTRIIM
jgi:hypothetical protein